MQHYSRRGSANPRPRRQSRALCATSRTLQIHRSPRVAPRATLRSQRELTEAPGERKSSTQATKVAREVCRAAARAPGGHATFSAPTRGGPGERKSATQGDQSRAEGPQGCSECAQRATLRSQRELAEAPGRATLRSKPRRSPGGGEGGRGFPVPPLVPPCPPSSDSFPQPTLLLWKGQHHNHAKHGMVLKGSEETAGESQLKVQHYSRQGQSLAPGPIKGAALFAPGPIEGAALFAPG